MPSLHPDCVNNQGAPLMTDLLAGHFGALRKEIHLLRMQLKTSPYLLNTIPKPVTSWTTALRQCTALTEELKCEITDLKNRTPLPTTPHMITDDIEHMILRTAQSLILQPDAPTDTDITNPALAATIAAALTTYIATVTSGTINTFKTVQTNELALQKISDTSVALTRTVKLNKIEDDHKHLLDQHAFLAK